MLFFVFFFFFSSCSESEISIYITLIPKNMAKMDFPWLLMVFTHMFPLGGRKI